MEHRLAFELHREGDADVASLDVLGPCLSLVVLCRFSVRVRLLRVF